jgi:transcriptional regulator with GAF, ATPase, and Fis domain
MGCSCLAEPVPPEDDVDNESTVARVGCAPEEILLRIAAATGRQPRGDGQVDARLPVLVAADLGAPALAAVRRLVASGATRILVIATGLGGTGGSEVWPLLRAGAGDILAWDPAQPELSAESAASRLRRWREVDEILASPRVRDHLVGRSPAWTAAMRDLVEIARSSDVPVLITGESGTGKELAAAVLHDLDLRPHRRAFVVVDCTTIVPTLSGSEFFGHERGAFTGATTAREGAFAEADGGTLFLDEIGDLPLELQAELLRVIQEGMYKRVGSGLWQRTRFRLVCATNRDLRAEVANGRFRADLFHRIVSWVVRLPPLRERTGDVSLLATHFLREMLPSSAAELDPAVAVALERREYPGNVRELRHLVARIAGRHVGAGPVTPGDLPPEERPCRGAEEPPDWRDGELRRCVSRALASRASLHEIGRAAEEVAIAIALEESGENVRRAALRLGISDRALQMRRAGARRNGAPDPAD